MAARRLVTENTMFVTAEFVHVPEPMRGIASGRHFPEKTASGNEKAVQALGADGTEPTEHSQPYGYWHPGRTAASVVLTGHCPWVEPSIRRLPF